MRKPILKLSTETTVDISYLKRLGSAALLSPGAAHEGPEAEAMNTKKHEKSGATGLRSRWRCEKCAKSRVSRFRSKVPSAHGARDIFWKIFGAAPVGWPGGRGQTTQRLTETRTMHGASSFCFSHGPLDRRHGPEDAPAQRTDVPFATGWCAVRYCTVSCNEVRSTPSQRSSYVVRRGANT